MIWPVWQYPHCGTWCVFQAACSGFTQYGYAFIQQEADYVEAQDLERATAMRARARKLYLRALDYGLRGLEVDYPGLRDRLRQDPNLALAKTKNLGISAGTQRRHDRGYRETIARIHDEDGDATQYGWYIPNPSIAARANFDQVEVYRQL